MADMITPQDEEFKSMEQHDALGDDQPIGNRVNNRTLAPRSHTFAQFMATGWDHQEPAIEPLKSSEFTPARLKSLGQRFAGERLVIPAGVPKVRNNDCDYAFRPDSAFSYYTGLGQDYEAGSVLVLNPVDSNSPEAADGVTHTPQLFVAPRADSGTQDYYRDAHYGEYWVGPRAGLVELAAMTGIETHDIAGLPDALGKDVGTEEGAVRVQTRKSAIRSRPSGVSMVFPTLT